PGSRPRCWRARRAASPTRCAGSTAWSTTAPASRRPPSSGSEGGAGVITARRRAGLGLILGVLVGAAGCGGALRGPAHPGAGQDSLRHAARPTEHAGEISQRETRLNGHLVLGTFPVPVSPSPGSASVSWAREVGAGPAGAERLIALGTRGTASPRDSLAAWREAARDPVLGVYALRPIARLALALGDTAGADSAWARLAGLRSLWGWEAVRSRCDLALARRDTARADALLASADRAEWPDAERAEWMGRR